MRPLFQVWHRQYSDLPAGATVLHDPGTQQYSDLPPGATVLHAPGALEPHHDWTDPFRGAAAGVKQLVTHPIDSLFGMPNMGGMPGVAFGPAGDAAMKAQNDAVQKNAETVHEFVEDTKDQAKDHPAFMAGELVGPALVAHGLSKAVRVAPAAARAVADMPEAVKRSATKLVAGSKLDQPIPGDTVTPRELYQTAKKMGVNLDTAQATGSAVTQGVKRATEHSLGGGPTFEANKIANTNALYVQAEKVLNDAHTQAASREQFGNQVRTRLLEDQEAQNSGAGALFDELTHDIGNKQPNVADVKTQASKIVAENASYYSKHPEMLTGGTKKAWDIVQALAKPVQDGPTKSVASSILDESGKPIMTEVPGKPGVKETWSDLHKLRSDLMDITRGPELVGDRPIGWMKQMTSAVDKSMTEAGSGLNGAALEKFRNANQIYARMKQTYDNPNSALYHVIRATDGLKAADQLLSARMSPAVARQIAAAAPDLFPQLQRQTISKLLSPSGNEVPDLQNLPARFSRAQKEALRGVLTPEQIQSMEDLSRVSRAVKFDSNPSGSGKTLQAHGELSAAVGGAVTGAATLNPVIAAAPVAYTVGTKLAAKALTSPKFTEAVLSGSEGWAAKGAAKLASHGVSAADIDALRSTPAGKSLLMKASSLTPGSAMMANIVAQIQASKQRK